MKTFAIRDLQRFTGIKTHTLRVWERRYGLLSPERNDGNSRVYSLTELKKILDISLLNKNGHRISVLSKIPSNDIESLDLRNDDIKWQKATNDLIVAMYAVQPESFERLLDSLLLKWPVDILVEKIIFPFLKVTGLLWTGHKLSEEHLVVTAIRKKLMLAIETSESVHNDQHRVLLFLPDSRQLDLGLLYTNYFLKKRNIHVLYLGIDVNIQNLKSIFQVVPVTYAFTYLLPNHNFPKYTLLDYMNEYAPHSKLLVGEYLTEGNEPVFQKNLVSMNYEKAMQFLVDACA